jgi:hypothetical protein
LGPQQPPNAVQALLAITTEMASRASMSLIAMPNEQMKTRGACGDDRQSVPLNFSQS